jgi:hypothetical protein
MSGNIAYSYRTAEEIKKECEEIERSPKRTKTGNAEFVQDGLQTVDIRGTIKNIRDFVDKNKNMSQEDIVKKLEVDHDFFAKRYPMLFDMATDKKPFDYKSLEYFLNMRDKVIADEITSEQASIKVGQEWFDKHIDKSKLQKKQ